MHQQEVAKLEEEQLKNARTITVEGRPVQDKDEVVLDFEGFVDGEAFEGGKGEDYPLTIGSGSFIPGFEEQLIGKSRPDGALPDRIAGTINKSGKRFRVSRFCCILSKSMLY